MKRFCKKGLIILVSLTLSLGLMPAAAFAEVGDTLSSAGDDGQNAQVVGAVQETQGEEAPQIGDTPEQNVAQVEDVQEQALPQDDSGIQSSSVDDQVADEPEASDEASEPTRESGSVTTVQMALGGSYPASIEEGSYWVGKFTAPEDGTYVFSSSNYDGDTYGYLYADQNLSNELTYDDDSGTGNNFAITYTLDAGETVYLMVRGINDQALECTVSVTAELVNLDYAHIYLVEDYYENTDEPVELEIDCVADANGRSLSSDAYTLVYYDADLNELGSAPHKPGDYYVAARAVEGTNYSGESGKVSFSILADNDLRNGYYCYFRNTSRFAPNQYIPIEDVVIQHYVDGYYSELVFAEDYEFYGFKNNMGVALETSPTEIGSYYAVYRGLEPNYTGTIEAYFQICDPHDLNGASVNVLEQYVELNNGSAVPNVVVTDITGNELREGIDYALEYYIWNDDDENRWVQLPGAPDSIGEYYVKAVPASGSEYQGESEYSRFIVYDPYDLSAYGLDFNNASYYEYTDEGSIPVFLFTGTPVEPTPSVYARSGSWQEIDSSNYTVTYTNNDRESTDGELASITVTGTGNPYHGSITKQFKLLSKFDISRFISQGCQIWVGQSSRYYSPSSVSYRTPTYLYTGWPIKPTINFNGPSDRTLPVQGQDFTISYTTAGGTAVSEPTEPGEYRIVLTATENGILTGTAEIPFVISVTKSMSELYPSLQRDQNSPISSSGSSGEGYTYYRFYETLDHVGDLIWNLRDGAKLLAENLDYTISVIENGASSLTYIFTGKGSYEGTVRADVYFANSNQDSFNQRYVYASDTVWDAVDGTSYTVWRSVYAYIGANGLFEDDATRFEGLTAGVDYEFDGYVDANGNTVTTAAVSDVVYARFVGLGEYTGCERLIERIVAVGNSTIDLNNTDLVFTLTNGVKCYDENYQWHWYLPRNTTPNVSIAVYGHNQLAFTEGNGFTVATSLGDDSMSITLNATEGSPVSGSTTKKVNLIDELSLDSFIKQVYIADLSGQSNIFIVGKSDAVQLSYFGVPFTPRIMMNDTIVPFPTYSVVLKNSSGNIVNQITSAGTYTLTLEGYGSWSGSIAIPLQVTGIDETVDIAQCGMGIVGDTSLNNGVSKPAVVLSSGSYTLKENEDYTLEYGNNTAVGNKAWVKATAIKGSHFSGSRSMNFIVGDDSANKVLNKFDYEIWLKGPGDNSFASTDVLRAYYFEEGSTAGPTVEVRAKNSYTPIDSSNYDVEYGNLSKTGLGYVKVTGKNEYSGSLSVNFYVITPQALITGWQKGNDGKWYYYEADGSMAVNKWQKGNDGKWRYLGSNGARVEAKWQKVGNTWYYFDADGCMVTDQWMQDSKGWVYLGSDGTMIIDTWKKVDGKWYYLGADGYRVENAWVADSGGLVFLGADGAMVTNGWVEDDAGRHYVDAKGHAYKNKWQKLDGEWYYFDADGVALANQWKKDSVGWVYLGPDGAMVTNGWAEDSSGSCYLGPDGYMLKSTWVEDGAGRHYVDAKGHAYKNKWQKLDGEWYYFDADGVALANQWKKDSVGWVYLGPDGAMVTNGWAEDSSGSCYLGPDGYMIKSTWVEDGAGRHYVDAKGHAYKNKWQKLDGEWYYFDADGVALANQWKKDSVGWVYLGPDGAMVTNGWAEDSSGSCYLGPDGYMLKSTWVEDGAGRHYVDAKGHAYKNKWQKLDGEWYYFDADGVALANQWKKDSVGWVYLGPDGAMVTNAWQKDSVGWCYLGANGYAVKNAWQADSTGMCYLDENCRLTIGWKEISGKTYWFDSKGHMVTGERVIDGVTYTFGSDGALIG